MLRSRKFPALDGEVTQKCLSFWFSPFGRSESTMLNVYLMTENGDTGDADVGETAPKEGGEAAGNQVLLWSIQTRKFDTRRPQWYYGQVTVNAEAPHQVKIRTFVLVHSTCRRSQSATFEDDAAILTSCVSLAVCGVVSEMRRTKAAKLTARAISS